MRVAYSYLRFSTPEQIVGDSIRRQTTKTRDWCERKGVHLNTTLSFEDLGRSAFTGSHFNEGALGVFFSLVKDGTIKPGSYLVIESLDRFSRENAMTAAGRLFDLVKAGITVVTVDDDREYSPESLGGSDVTAMLILVIKLTQAHVESVRKQDLIRPIWNEKKNLARSKGLPLTSRCPEWLEVRDDKFHLRPDRVEVVRRIIRETISGFGRREIVSRLNGDGILPFKAGQNWKTPRPFTGWQSSSVAKIVSNRAVLGEYQPHKGRAGNREPDGDPIKDFYPRIIDDVTYWRAQNALLGRRHQTGGRRGKAGAHILRGLARCGKCGGAMHVVNKGPLPKGGVYLRCDTNKRNLGCGNSQAWRVDRLEDAVIRSVSALDISTFSAVDDATSEAEAQVEALSAEVSHLEVSRTQLLKVLETGDDAVITRFQTVADSLKAKRHKLDVAKTDVARLSNDPGIVVRLTEAATLSRQLQTAEDKDRHDLRVKLSAILRTVIDRIACVPTYGAVMIIPQRKLWHANLTGFAVRMEPNAIYVLLDSDVDSEVANHFIADFGNDFIPTGRAQ
ncbi:recombinase family protein [Pararhizobium sp. DWP3-4]|uniref:recombinase family protein n=1 Tax=Pararhizobium sp. DWP3-4 TaxID=2804565 RepID=UPI003CF4C40A